MSDHFEMGLEEQKESLHLEQAMKSPRATAEQMVDPHSQEADDRQLHHKIGSSHALNRAPNQADRAWYHVTL